MFDIDLNNSVSGFDVQMSQPTSGRVYVKISSIFNLYPIFVKIGGIFVQKTALVKIGGTFS